MRQRTRLKIKLYRPHPGQAKIHLSKARFRIVACGRRFGKTLLAVNEIVKQAWERPGTTNFWIAPTYAQSKIALNLVLRHFRRAVREVNKSELWVELLSGGRIDFKSAERPDNLRGFGIHFVVIDEAGYIRDEVWKEVVRPALIDTRGRLLAIGTPKGRNWFYELWLKGQGDDPDYKSWQMPTWVNPYIPRSEIEELRRTLPERVFRQEIEAEFLEESGGVFRNWKACVQEYDLPARAEGSVSIGVDLAKYEDFTVIVAVDETGRVVYFDRFNQIDWALQKARILKAYSHFPNATVVVDATGVGDPIYEDLRRVGVRVVPYKFTPSSKEVLINTLSVAIENQEVVFPPIPELLRELQAFEYQITKSGRVKMGAPPGLHDDTVIALALAVWGLRRSGGLAVGSFVVG